MSREKRRLYLSVVLIAVVSFAVYGNSLKAGFMWDDKTLIKDNRYIESLEYIPFFFSPVYWNRYQHTAKSNYRPAGMATFAIDHYIWGTDPFGYHLTNVIFHALNSILVYFLVFRLIPHGGDSGWSRAVPLLSALFFALHPIHTESVNWIKNRFDIFSLLFFILTILLFIKYTLAAGKRARNISYAGALFCYIFAVFSKETAIVLPLILALYIICFSEKEEYRRMLPKTFPFFGIMALYLFFVFNSILNKGASGNGYKMDLYHNLLAVIKTAGVYLKLLILPLNLNAERLFSAPVSLFEPAVFFSALFLFLLVFFSARVACRGGGGKSGAAAFFLFWIILTLLPVANIIFIASRPIAEQRLYIPSAGYCAVLAMLIAGIPKLSGGCAPRSGITGLSTVLAASVMISYSAITIDRNSDWKDPVTFWHKTVQSSPASARAYNNLGIAYKETGRNEEAIDMYEKAISLSPRFAEAYNNMGSAYDKLSRHQDALACLKKAVEIKSDYLDAYYNLGSVYIKLDRWDSAARALQSAIEIDPRDTMTKKKLVDLYYEMGNSFADEGENDKAIEAYRKVIEIDPYHAEAHNQT
jgi:tetratricopeptide (TPR) repeat protein